MSKSNSAEIIAILWLIAGLLSFGLWQWIFWGFAIENMIESIVWSYKARKP